ncbi:MAG: DUF4923 family protein [Cytophagaceae bacterium]|nr:DUF4923 family protein [Cytophagaceae bacterium]MDW8457137.1 DUF4923 family protein [Cytophagaceae bacterium]
MKKIFYFLLMLCGSFMQSCDVDTTKQLQKKWIANQVVIGPQKVNAEVLGGVWYEFKEDNTFASSWGAELKKGKWSYDKNSNKLSLTFDSSKAVIEASVINITSDSLQLEYSENELKRTLFLYAEK